LRAGVDAAKAGINQHHDVSAAQVTHNYLSALCASSSVEAARAAILQSEALLNLADWNQARVDMAKATGTISTLSMH
jgi:hypothetical protein